MVRRRIAAAALVAGVLAGLAGARGVEAVPAGGGPPAVKRVANELVRYGARNAFVYVSVGGRTYSAAAGSGSPRRPADIFRIGSTTKSLVAALILRLAEEGELRLDDDVERYLPRTIPLGRLITLRQLLNHTSGIANYTRYPDWLARAERARSLTPADVLRFAASRPRVFARPGTSFSYSNTNYIALGLVIEKVTGNSLERELLSRLGRPLGLDQTSMAPTRRVQGLVDAGTNPSLPWAAGGVVSSTTDLVRFFSALLAGKVISADSLAAMQETAVNPLSPVQHYGLGLERYDLSCGTYWGNAGRILDYSSYVNVSADGRDVAVVLLRGRSDRQPDITLLLCD